MMLMCYYCTTVPRYDAYMKLLHSRNAVTQYDAYVLSLHSRIGVSCVRAINVNKKLPIYYPVTQRIFVICIPSPNTSHIQDETHFRKAHLILQNFVFSRNKISLDE